MTRNEEILKMAERIVSEQLNGKNVSSEVTKKMVHSQAKLLQIMYISIYGSYGIINNLKQE